MKLLPVLSSTVLLLTPQTSCSAFRLRSNNHTGRDASPIILGERSSSSNNQALLTSSSSSSSYSYGYPTLPLSPDLKPWRPQDERTTDHPSSSVTPPSSITQHRQHRRYPHRSSNLLTSLLSTSTTTKLLATNAIMFLLQTLNPRITQWGAKLSQPLLQGQQLHRLITPIFLHGGVSHLVVNSMSLHNIGPHVERMFGTRRYVTLYMVAGVMGNVLSAVLSPNPSVGASGAIFGLIGGYYTFLRMNESFFGKSGQRGMAAMKQTLTLNLLFGLSSPSIDNWGHMGGVLGGAAMAYCFGPKLYLVDVNAGGRKVLVDQPRVRMPKKVRDVGEGVRMQWWRLKRRWQVDRYRADLSKRPWRR